MQTNKDELSPSRNVNLDMIKTTTTIIKEEESEPGAIRRENTLQPIKESYYSKKVTTSTKTNNSPPIQAMKRFSYSGVKPSDSYDRSGTKITQTTITTTTTTTTALRGKNGKNDKNKNTSPQGYKGNQNKVLSPRNNQNISKNYQLKRPESGNKKRALSPEPESLKKKTINRGKPVENVQITHIIDSSKPTDFHITEKLNFENLNSGPIDISQTERKRLRKTGKVTSSSSCDKIDIKKQNYNLKGKTTIYQHARGIGMTNDKKELNPLFYSSGIKKLDPVQKKKEKEKIEHIETFRSSGKNLASPNITTTKTTKTTRTTNNYTRPNYKPNRYRSVATNQSNNKEVGNNNNKGVTTTSTIRTTNYKRGNTNAENGDGEIIKETNIKVQIGSRSYKNKEQPKTYITREKKVYNQKNFFNK
jgi:hypothetical protein